MAEELISVESITPIQAARPTWKIMTPEFGVYYSESLIVLGLAERALRERKLLKVDGVADGAGRVMLDAVVILERAAPLRDASEKERHSPNRLF